MEWNLPELILDKNFLHTTHVKSAYCVCCLAKDVQYVSLKKCVHFTFLDIFFGKMLKKDLVCLRCHKMLQNFHRFKLQVEESIRLMRHQIDLPNIKKLHSFQTNNIEIYNTASGEKLENTTAVLTNYTTKSENVVCKIERFTDSSEDNSCDDRLFIVDNSEMEIPTVNIKEELADSIPDSDSNMMKQINVQSTESNNNENKTNELNKNDVTHNLYGMENMSQENETDLKLYSVEEPSTSVPNKKMRFSCEHCGREFWWRCHLVRHVMAAHVTCNVACEHCPKAFRNKLALKRHIQWIHEKKYVKSYSPVQCPICLKMFKLEKTLRVHLNKIHRPDTYKEEERYCVECNKLFKSKCNYKLHLTKSLKHAADKFECHDCGRKFTTKGNLFAHIQRLHLKRKQYACDVCGKQFFSRYQRRLHEQHNHLGVPRTRDHVCAVCGKGFTCSQVLKRHLVIHSGVKPYQCRLCPSSFTQRSTLATHCKFKHKDATQPNNNKQQTK